MSVTHPTAVRSAIADFVVDQLDVGGPGKLVFRTSGTADSPGSVAATLTLSSPAFGDASSGVATAAGITTNTSVVGHASPVATATLETAGGVVKVHCAVAVSGSDINVSSGGLTVTAGDTVACSALTYTAPV